MLGSARSVLLRSCPDAAGDARLLGLFSLSLVVALVGGASFFFDLRTLRPLGLCWNASADQSFALWVHILWPVAVALAPLSYRNGFFGVCLYLFVNLSIQGSESAARSLLADGALDWLIGLISLSYFLATSEFLSTPEAGGKQRPATLRQPAVICLIALAFWVAVCWLVRYSAGEMGEPRVYRRPILWLHCLAIFWIAAESLSDQGKRVGLVAFLAFCLAWRVAVTPHSLWLEGHVASFLVFLLPWALLAAFRPLEQPLWLAGLYSLLAFVWVSSLWNEPSFTAEWLQQRFGPSSVVALAVVAVTLFWLVPQAVWGQAYFLACTLAILATVLMIQNRGAALGAAATLLVAALLAPPTWRLRVPVLGLVVFAVIAGARYEPLAERFRRSLREGGSGQERLELWRIAWQSSHQHPWFGVGPGQFPHIVRQYQPDMSSRLDTHQSWLEMLSETGWPGAILFTGFWLLVVAAAMAELLAGQGESGGLAGRDPSSRSGTWVARATLAFFFGYLVIGLFGSRHNVPLVYALAALPISVRLARASGSLPSKGPA